MPQISGDELETVVERGRGYLQVGVGERHSSAAHLRLDVPTYPGNRDIEGSTVIAGSTFSSIRSMWKSGLAERKAPLYSSPMATALAN